MMRPFLTGMLLAFLPHLIGSAVNINYNASRIIGQLDERQTAAFTTVAIGYNLVIYPLCVALAIYCFGRAVKAATATELGGDAAGQTRRDALALPMWAVGISLLGWLPGAIVFPALIHAMAGPISLSVAGHFVVSFMIAGLIALTYSVVLTQYFAVRVLYPQAWSDGTGYASAVAGELVGIDQRLGRLQVLAGLIPLIGAVLMIGFEADAGADRTYRILTSTLIMLGMVGFMATQFVCDRVRRTLAALRGATP
jgi:hypothetical protein